MKTDVGMSKSWKLVGFVGVDSEQVLICDPCYLPKRRLAFEEKYGKRFASCISSSDLSAPSVEEHCGGASAAVAELAHVRFGAVRLYYHKGHHGAGVVSGMVGDGIYPVYARADALLKKA